MDALQLLILASENHQQRRNTNVIIEPASLAPNIPTPELQDRNINVVDGIGNVRSCILFFDYTSTVRFT